MKCLVTLLTAVLAVSEGVKWNDFRVGNTKLPMNLREAESRGWVMTDFLGLDGVRWYSKDNDLTFTLSFDQQTGYCAGVRVIVYEKEIDSKFRKCYTQSDSIFDRIDINGEIAYMSTVFFSPNGYVKDNKQDLKPEDEVAYFVLLKETSGHKMLNREVCEQAAGPYTEQGCLLNYGLVMSHFESDTRCKNLKPFYTIYSTGDTGDLVGFGWIIFSDEAKSMAIKITSNEAKEMFPRGPSCLISDPNLAVVEVWLAYNVGKKTYCPSTSWVDEHCGKVKKKYQETQQSKQSLWSKLFG